MRKSGGIIALIAGILALFGRQAGAAGAAAALLAALSMTTPQVVRAQEAKTIDVIDFLVDRDELIGKVVTITGCAIGSASDSVVLCSAGAGRGNVMIDSKTLAKEDLRKALKQCAGFSAMTPEHCAGSVTGTVTRGSFGLRVTKARIGWRLVP